MKRSGGFTLIELMVVMGLMILISSIVVSGTFGMTRSASYRAAENVVYNALQAARQQACTDGKRVIVAFVNDRGGTDEANALSIIEATGTITEDVSGNYIQDRCANLAKYTGSGVVSSGSDTKNADTVWNLRTGASFSGFTITRSDDVTYKMEPIPGGGTEKYRYTVTRIEPKNDKLAQNFWAKGDPYGFQITQSQTLPRGFKIGFGAPGASPAGKLLVFEPDGTGFAGSEGTGLTRPSGTSESDLYLYEEIFASDAKKAVHIKVTNGIVSVVPKKQ